MKEMHTAATDVCELMGILSNESRLMILCLLVEGEKSVGQLVEAIGAREPAISQHLAILRRQGLVQTRRKGKAIYYSIVGSKTGSLLQTLHDIYCDDERQPKET